MADPYNISTTPEYVNGWDGSLPGLEGFNDVNGKLDLDFPFYFIDNTSTGVDNIDVQDADIYDEGPEVNTLEKSDIDDDAGVNIINNGDNHRPQSMAMTSGLGSTPETTPEHSQLKQDHHSNIESTIRQPDNDDVVPKPRRSRNGCDSCKKLRIKCNEQRPVCEYCSSTHRECIYSINLPRKLITKPNNKYLNKLIKQLEQQVNHDKLPHCPSDDLSLSLNLTSTSSQLKISHFELKLVKYFKIYSIPFTAFINGPLHQLCTVEIPSLFKVSPLVRYSVYAFSCLNSWTICHLKHGKPTKSMNVKNKLRQSPKYSQVTTKNLFDTNLKFLDDLIGKTNEEIGWENNSAKMPQSMLNASTNLYTLTSYYFLNLVSDLNTTLANEIDNSTGIETLPMNRAKEVLIGGLVMVLYLGVHSHNVTPLVRFDENFNYIDNANGLVNLNSDILTIGEVIVKITNIAYVSISHSMISNLFRFKLGKISHRFPLTARLRDDFQRYKSQCTDAEYKIISHNLDILEFSFDKAGQFHSPMPIFKFIIVCTPEFRNLIRRKNFFALRILYVQAFVMQHLRFGLFSDKNIWMDYIRWFKSYNFTIFGKWNEPFDCKLYYLSDHGVNLEYESASDFINIDPEDMYNNAQ